MAASERTCSVTSIVVCEMHWTVPSAPKIGVLTAPITKNATAGRAGMAFLETATARVRYC